MPKDRGTCRNFTVRWFFDMEYGGCSRFWYGGCDGNDNSFETQESCKALCVEPEGMGERGGWSQSAQHRGSEHGLWFMVQDELRLGTTG